MSGRMTARSIIGEAAAALNFNRQRSLLTMVKPGLGRGVFRHSLLLWRRLQLHPGPCGRPGFGADARGRRRRRPRTRAGKTPVRTCGFTNDSRQRPVISGPSRLKVTLHNSVAQSYPPHDDFLLPVTVVPRLLYAA